MALISAKLSRNNNLIELAIIVKKINGDVQAAPCHRTHPTGQSKAVTHNKISIPGCVYMLRKFFPAMLIFMSCIPGMILAEDIFDRLNQSMKEEEAALEKKAGTGDVEAQMLLGNQYTSGGFFGADKEKIRKGVGWYRRAAEQGHIPALLQMADYAVNGKIKEADVAEALFWLSKAANRGDPASQYTAADMYFSGIGTPVNMAEGERLLRLSVEQGYPDAQRSLGMLNLSGDIVNKNEGEAFRLFTLAAEQDDAASQYMVGMMYASGIGTEKNTDKAVVWLRKSAEGGNANARKTLGLE